MDYRPEHRTALGEMAAVEKRPRYAKMNGVIYPEMFSPECFREAMEYKAEPGDVFIDTYPKCGTTWMQNVAMYIFRKGRELDQPSDFLRLAPFMDMLGRQGIDEMPRPGAIKTHLPFSRIPYSSDAKYVFVARNPSDCCVSFYHHARNEPGFGFWDGEFDDFFELFMAGELEYNDYFDHLLDWYPHRNDPNVFYTTNGSSFSTASRSVSCSGVCSGPACTSVPNGAVVSGTSVEPGFPRLLVADMEGRRLFAVANDTRISCIPSGIDSFPSDFLSEEDRQRGGIVVHILIAAYTCVMIGIVCHDYFVPSLEIIAERIKLPPDIAGATFMAIGTSAPELFSSITGSFITEGDIGVGTIIGSAVFNIVGVTGMVGVILWNKVLDIDWYPIARDCIAYGFTVFTLIWIIADNIVRWWESFILLMIFVLYIVIIYFNRTIEKCSRKLVEGMRERGCCCGGSEERTLLAPAPEIVESQKVGRRLERDSFSVEFTASREEEVLRQESVGRKLSEILWSDEHTNRGTLCASPTEGGWKMFRWIILYPARLIFFFTIPDSRKPKWYRLFPLTFAMSVLWIGVLSYVAVWMVTVIGYTFNVPDSVSGLTILAAGTSIPEIISSIIVAQNGYGNMAISNLVGSNTFDISFCLGGPWLIKTLTSKKGFVIVYSSALTYTTATLLITLVAFVLVFVFSGWKLNKTVGMIYFLLYVVFVIIACMYEMNVFGDINAKTCE